MESGKLLLLLDLHTLCLLPAGVASYQGYGSTGDEANFDTVAFRSPTLTVSRILHY